MVITHFAFQIMVGFGMLMMLIGIIYFWKRWKNRSILDYKWGLWTIILAMPIGFIALEAGWIVTEVGRQPWIIYGIMKTREALTSMPGIQYSLITVIVVYTFLTGVIVWLMSRQISSIHKKYEV